MAEDVVIRAEGLGKKYVIGHQAERERYVALRDVLARNARNFARSARDLVTGRPNVAGDEVEEFWALKEVNFDIRRGDVVGIIGRNGAGKSTLLKILSRITEPTTGKVEIRGRVASLLEVGTGFHPELTGRENIFLNGAILGMTRAEIRRKFDEIVAFAGVERFLDTPVKRYSSGMYVRLAFAVAAHLEPEILVVDEVLAVGDAEFQKKCLGKMQDVAAHGRTVLFVSHNMAAIEQLCGRATWLDSGQIRHDGAVKAVVADYLSGSTSEVLEWRPPTDPGRPAEITRIALCDDHGKPVNQVTTADTPRLRVDIIVRERRTDLRLAVLLHDSMQTPIFATCPPDAGVAYPTDVGAYSFMVEFTGPLLLAQRYSVTPSLYSSWGHEIHILFHALTFDALPRSSPVYSVDPNRMGSLQMFCNWRLVEHATA
jgi:ABC-type polysaccharide/polyol phosphate transport system ATPase subunit